ncbi:MAG: hypothetical protein R3D98_16535 [Candidatus Krumholzibacteriia bacterium]
MRRDLDPRRTLPLLAGLLLALATVASAQTPTRITVQVLAADGRPLTGGTVAVCPAGADCQEVAIDGKGFVHLDRELLLRSSALTIVVYGTDGATRYVTSDWLPSAADRRLLSNQPARTRGLLRGTPALRVQLTFTTAAAAQAAAQVAAAPPPPVAGSRPGPSAWRLGAGVAWLVGGAYTQDDAALGGVTDVAPGLSFLVARSLGLPATWPAGRSSVSYLEVGLSYAANRYTVRQFDTAGTSDLTFHRFSLEAGPGRAWRHGRLALLGVLGYGGVYDGTTLLDRDGRRYAMFGLGVTARASRRVLTVGGGGIALMAQASAVHYLADANDHDHWYGTAPSILVGLVSE